VGVDVTLRIHIIVAGTEYSILIMVAMVSR